MAELPTDLTFAQKFRWALDHYPGPDGLPRSMASLARQISLQHPADPLKKEYLYKLLSGERDNPSKNVIEHLAQALGCSVLLFFDHADVEQQRALDELRTLRQQADEYRRWLESREGQLAHRMSVFTDLDMLAFEDVVKAFERNRQRPPDASAGDERG